MIALLAAAGCRPVVLEETLVGSWVGTPDSASQREQRTPSVLSTLSPGAEVDVGGTTDIEAFDFQITLQFAPGGQVEMWLGRGERKLTGQWLVVSQESDRAVLEIVNKDAASGAPEQRRFEIHLEPDAAGFTLREEGADPAFGWLYFKRAS